MEEEITGREEAMAAHVEQLLAAAGEGAEVVLYERVHLALLRPAAYSARDRLID